MEKRKNYCTLSPDTILGVYIGDACKLHDTHYRLNPKIMTRKETDLVFLEQLKEKLNKWYNRWIAYLYYFVVRLLCGPSWERWKYFWFLGFIPIPRRK